MSCVFIWTHISGDMVSDRVAWGSSYKQTWTGSWLLILTGHFSLYAPRANDNNRSNTVLHMNVNRITWSVTAGGWAGSYLTGQRCHLVMRWGSDNEEAADKKRSAMGKKQPVMHENMVINISTLPSVSKSWMCTIRYTHTHCTVWGLNRDWNTGNRTFNTVVLVTIVMLCLSVVVFSLSVVMLCLFVIVLCLFVVVLWLFVVVLCLCVVMLCLFVVVLCLSVVMLCVLLFCVSLWSCRVSL